MDTIVIRKAKDADISSLQGLTLALTESDCPYDQLLSREWSYNKEGETYVKEHIRGDRKVCFVAEYENKLVGYAAGEIKEINPERPVASSELHHLYISPSMRGQGVGGKLVAAFKEWSKEKGMKKIAVNVYTANVSAVKFYKKQGFQDSASILEMSIDS